MATNNFPEIKTDPVLKRLVQPLSKKALADLRNDLISNVISCTVLTWNGLILFDYEKYELCRSMNLPIQTKEKDFQNFEHAASYLCTRQMTRGDLTNEYRKYLIGELFHFEDQRLFLENPDRTRTKYRVAYKIGEQLNMSGVTVIKYSTYASAINTIFEQSTPFALRILMGKTRVSHENVIELSRLAPEELRTVADSAIKEKMTHLTFSDIRHEVKYTHTKTKARVSRREVKEQKEKITASIRQMPAYNPDAEVNSLCMTINSWVSSIERVNTNTDFRCISNRAMLELMKQLTILESSINSIQKSLIERTAIK